jgi:o-succinylbenzoate---CoA ligase
MQDDRSSFIHNCEASWILDYLERRKGKSWLINCDPEIFARKVNDKYRQIGEISKTAATRRAIVVTEDAIEFLSAFLAAISANCIVFLGDPTWVDRQWQEVLELVQPDTIVGEKVIKGLPKKRREDLPSGAILIPTGGSSGKIRFAIHTWETLAASARGFYEYFDRETVNSFCILPLYHVGGLMQFVRSFLTEGKFAIFSYETIKTKIDDFQNSIDSIEDFFISLVPTQLKFILDNNPSFLSGFKAVFVGGSAIWEGLLDGARQKQIYLAPTYGMTETAAQIATLKPVDFLQVNNSCGRVLPHVRVTIRGDRGEILEVGRSGVICVESDSLFLGYYEANSIEREDDRMKVFATDDIGYLDESGYLYIIGRNSQKIVTGGKNVFPAEVEAIIFATGLVSDICAIGLADNYWGQAVTAVCVLKENNSLAEVRAAIEGKLSKYKYPKHWVSVNSLGRDCRGKLNYKTIEQLASTKLNIF